MKKHPRVARAYTHSSSHHLRPSPGVKVVALVWLVWVSYKWDPSLAFQGFSKLGSSTPNTQSLINTALSPHTNLALQPHSLSLPPTVLTGLWMAPAPNNCTVLHLMWPSPQSPQNWRLLSWSATTNLINLSCPYTNNKSSH